MALVKKVSKKEQERYSVHGEVEATYSVFENDNGKYLQIDTYGLPSRQIPGKRSQSLQVDKDGARALINVLKEQFKL